MTPLAASGWQLSKLKDRSKMPPRTASDGIYREHFVPGPPKFESLSETFGPINLPDITSPVAFGGMQNATKYCKKGASNGSGVDKSSTIRLLFAPKSSKFAQTHRSTCSTTRPDTTLLATSRRLLWKFEQRPKMPLPTICVEY